MNECECNNIGFINGEWLCLECGEQAEQKNNYDYDESFADFNDCINGVNMNRKEAIQIIRKALECYVEDCISQDDELQHEVYEAFEILKTDERG